MNKTAAGLISVIACEFLFGFSFLFTKKVTESISAIDLLSWRFVTAFVLIGICAAAGIIKVDFRGKPALRIAAMAILFPVIYFLGETYGINLTTASESGIIIAGIPAAVLLFSAIFLKEPPTRLQTAGVAVAAAGILFVVISRGAEFRFDIGGYALLITAVVSFGLYSTIAQRSPEFNSAEKTFMMIASGAIVFTVIALFQNASAGTLRHFITLPFGSRDFAAAVLYLGAGSSVAAFLLYNIALTYIGMKRASTFVGLSTIVTVTASALILREHLTVWMGAGTALVLGGVYLANMPHPDASRDKGGNS